MFRLGLPRGRRALKDGSNRPRRLELLEDRRLLAVGAAPMNVILFVGDGMGSEHIEAGRYFANGDTAPLTIETLAHSGTMTHNNASNGTTDSAASGTAMATGRKANNGVISVALPGDGSELPTVLEILQARGKRAGLVTIDTEITDATPAGFGAHAPDRGNKDDIASDYFNVSRPNVLFGEPGDEITSASAVAAGYDVVLDEAQLLALDTEATDFVSGQFNFDVAGAPTLAQMTTSALNVLDNDPDGFFLLVEHEDIDSGGHANDISRVVNGVVELDEAVDAALNWATTNGVLDETLLIVLADHETGGLDTTGNNGAGMLPSVTWSTGGHTQSPVRVFASGPAVDASRVVGLIDNTDIFDILRSSTARLATPLDNGSLDLDPQVDAALVNDSLPEIQLEFSDLGAGVDASTVVTGAFAVTRDGAPLDDLADYTFSYDSGTRLATFAALGGDFADGVYQIAFNTAATHIADQNGNELAGTTFTVQIDTSITDTVSVSFQQGVGGYAGTVDTFVREASPDADNSTATPINVDGLSGGVGPSQGLLRFENIFGNAAGQIPSGSTILSANLDVNVSNEGNPIALHRMLQTWNDTDTWNSRTDGLQNDDVEAALAADATTFSVETGTLTIDVTASLTQWLSNPAENLGWAVLPEGNNGVEFRSAEGSIPPKLTVSFQPPPDGSETLLFQQGLRGYSGTIDTYVQEAVPEADNSAEQIVNVDGSDMGGPVQGLVRFEDLFGPAPGQVPLDATLVSATLDLQVTNTGSAMQLHRMLQTWSETTSWNSLSAGVQTDDSEAAAAADAITGPVRLGRLLIDVTPSVAAWLADPATNHGWALMPTSSSGLDFISSEGFLPPTLSVRFSRPLASAPSATALGRDGGAALAWVPSAENPQTRIVRKEGGYPSDEDDGTTVYEGYTTSFLDTVAPGTYFYAAFATDGSGNYSDPTNAGGEGTLVSASGLAPSLAVDSDAGVGTLAFQDADGDGTLRAFESAGALKIDLLGAAANKENDSLTVALDPAVAGPLTFEAQITTPAAILHDWNLLLQLGDGSASLDLAFRLRWLFARSDGGKYQTVIGGLAPATTYKLSVVIESGEATVYVDEDKKVKLVTPLNSLSQARLLNLGYATEDQQYMLDDVRVVAGTPIFHDPGPAGPGMSAAELNTVLNASSERTFSSVSLHDADSDGTIQGAVASNTLSLDLAGSAQRNEMDSILATLDAPISGLFTFRTLLTTPAVIKQEWNVQLELEDGLGEEIRLAFRLRNLFVRDGGTWRTVQSRLSPSTTYELALVVNTTAGTADFYIDGVQTLSSIPTSLANLSQLRLTNLGHAASDQTYAFEDILIQSGDVASPPPLVFPDSMAMSILPSARNVRGSQNNGTTPRSQPSHTLEVVRVDLALSVLAEVRPGATLFTLQEREEREADGERNIAAFDLVIAELGDQGDTTP